jgi:acetyltransferase-like isoleucine patch superfamily enzyme
LQAIASYGFDEALLMRGLAFLYRLRALLSRGSLHIAPGTRLPLSSRIRWKNGSVSLGDKISVCEGVIIDAQKGSIEIGSNVSLNDYTIILGHGGVVIGNDVRIAAQVMIASFDHNYEDPETPIRLQGITTKPIIIQDDVWIGSGAKILGGSHVAKGCVIAANAVIKGETVPFGVYGGIPARLLKMRGEDEQSDAAKPKMALVTHK